MQTLSGVRVADFTWALAGPFGTSLLAMMGAEVIKIESRKKLDSARHVAALYGWTEEPDVDKSVEFNLVNPGKLSLSLDLSNPKGVDIAKRLVACCDVVVDNFSAGVMARVGLGYPVLCEIKPDIIVASSAYSGQQGPESSYLGYAPLFHAASGMAYVSGYEDSPPAYNRGRTDTIVGGVVAMAILAALNHRQRTGKGQYIDISSRETISGLIGHFFMDYALNGNIPARCGNEEGLLCPHNCYPCRGDDRWITIAVATDQEWRALRAAMGNPNWAIEARFAERESRWQHRKELDAKIALWTRDFEAEQLTNLLQEAGVSAMHNIGSKEVVSDPHIRERGLLKEVEHPKLGKQVVFGPPFRMSVTPPQIAAPSPLMGEHNDYVLQDVLGLTPDEVALLESQGVLD